MSGVNCISHLFVWNTKSKASTIATAIAAGAVTITGIALLILNPSRPLGTGLLAAGSGVLLVDLLYIFLSKNRNKVPNEFTCKPVIFTPAERMNAIPSTLAAAGYLPPYQL